MRIEGLKIDREALLAQALRGAFPDERGRYGPFGGRYVPETLVPALDRLEAGEDPEKIEEEMGDLMGEDEDPFVLPGEKGAGKTGPAARRRAPQRDPTLYDL